MAVSGGHFEARDGQRWPVVTAYETGLVRPGDPIQP